MMVEIVFVDECLSMMVVVVSVVSVAMHAHGVM